jgi:hypothetical protein
VSVGVAEFCAIALKTSSPEPPVNAVPESTLVVSDLIIGFDTLLILNSFL